MTTMSRPPADPSAVRPGVGENFSRWLLFGLQDAKGVRQGPGAVSDSHLKKHQWWPNPSDWTSSWPGCAPANAGPPKLTKRAW